MRHLQWNIWWLVAGVLAALVVIFYMFSTLNLVQKELAILVAVAVLVDIRLLTFRFRQVLHTLLLSVAALLVAPTHLLMVQPLFSLT